MPLWRLFILLWAVLAVLPCTQAEDERLEKLYEAVETSDTDEVYKLLKAGVDPNGKAGGRELSAFHYAIERREGGIAKVFLNAGADPNSMVSKDESVLMLAAKHSNSRFPGSSSLEGVMKTMLESGADLHAHNEGALRMASGDSLELVKLLIQKGAKPNQECLIRSVERGKVDIFVYLLSQGMDHQARTPSGGNLFHMAASNIVYWLDEEEGAACRLLWQKLLSLGVPIEATDDHARTPLHVAAENSNTAILFWLLDQKVNINAVDHDGRTPLMLAALSNELWGNDCLRPLLGAGARVDIQDKQGLTVIQHLESGSDWQSILWLMQAGAKPTQHGELFRRLVESTLQANGASETIVIDLVRRLLPEAGEVNSIRVKTYSLLAWAVLLDSRTLAKELLKAGARIDDRDETGQTALDWAVKVRNPVMAKFLIQEGATDVMGTASNTSPLPFRQASGHSDDRLAESPTKEEPADAWSATAAGDLTKLRPLLQEDPSLLTAKRGGLQLVHLAAARGHVEVLAHLLELKPGLRSAKTVDDQTPLELAIAAKQISPLQWFVDHPGDAEKDALVKEAAQAVFKQGNSTLLMTLMDSGWSPQTHEERVTSLIMAAYAENMPLLERLRPLKLGAALQTGFDNQPSRDVFELNPDSMLANFANAASVEVMKFMLTVVNESSELDWKEHLAMALASCVREPHEEMLKLLLTAGKADINTLDKNKQALLHHMAGEGRRESAELLIQYGARADIKDAKGRTPAAVARAANHAGLAAWLEEQVVRQGSGKR